MSLVCITRQSGYRCCMFSWGQGRDFWWLEQGIKILPNAGQEQDKGLEEPTAHTHQMLSISSTVPRPIPLGLRTRESGIWVLTIVCIVGSEIKNMN